MCEWCVKEVKKSTGFIAIYGRLTSFDADVLEKSSAENEQKGLTLTLGLRYRKRYSSSAKYKLYLHSNWLRLNFRTLAIHQSPWFLSANPVD